MSFDLLRDLLRQFMANKSCFNIKINDIKAR